MPENLAREKKFQECKDRRTDVCSACEVFFWLDASSPRVEINRPPGPQTAAFTQKQT